MIPNFGSAYMDDGDSYVPNMTHNHHIELDGSVTVVFADTPADNSNVMPSTALGVGASLTELDIVLQDPFGRTLAFTSADADGVFIVHGRDFLSQQMSQQVTCVAGAGTTTKAFKFIDKIESVSNDGAIVVNHGPSYGLPFCAVELVREIVDGVASTEGTIIPAVSATPSMTTGDVRGTYNPATAGNAVKDISVTYISTNMLPGGLYGQPQA